MFRGKTDREVDSEVGASVGRSRGRVAAAKAGKGRSKKTEESVDLPPIEQKQIAVTIVGISPLITHAWGEKAKKMMRDKGQKKAQGPREAKDPKAEFESGRYRDSQGRDCVRAHFFKKIIVAAAKFGEGAKATLLKGSVYVEGDYIVIKHDRKVPTMREDHVRLRSQFGSTADLRYRPEYNNWSCDLVITYNARIFSAEQIVHLLQLGGFSVGLCEWRPEKGGAFGRFEVKSKKLGKGKRRG